MRGSCTHSSMVLARVGRRIVRFFYEHIILIIILAVGLGVWITVFNLAVDDYLATDLWRTRGVWLGNGDFDFFGYTVTYQYEGYTDHSFYYIHWGTNMVNGVMPYTPEFGYLELDGYVNENGAFMFPPLTAYFYALGIALPLGDCGIGFLITAFGYMIVFPVYGLGKELSNNRHVGEAAALTYLLNPNVLYHIAFVWMNPSPFIFFFFSGFYMLVRGNKNVGTLLIVTAALFKQTAWFLGIPLVVYLLIKPSSKDEDKKQPSDNTTETTTRTFTERFRGIVSQISSVFDFRGFLISTVMVLCFVLVIVFPFLVANPNMLSYLALATGSWPLESTTELPGYGTPIRLEILPVAAGLPWLAEILHLLVYFGFLLTLGVFLFMGLMFLEPRYKKRKRFYLRKLLFLTLLLMLWVHIAGPRGVYKYYFTLFAPFFSIFASTRMVTSEEETVPFSTSMLWIPLALSFAILIPPRSVYLFVVILIFIGYAMISTIGKFWLVLSTPTRYISSRIGIIFHPIISRGRNFKNRFESIIYDQPKEEVGEKVIPL